MPRIGCERLRDGNALHPCADGDASGSGTALGVVDLRVQRERHTQWPIIPRAVSKEFFATPVARSARPTRTQRKSKVGERERRSSRRRVRPGERDESSAHAGALSLTDARVLAFPVRSLRGVFAWVTCPAVLERLSRDAGLAGIDGFPSIPKPAKEGAACSKDSPLIVQGNHLVLEEFEFQRSGDADAIAGWIASTTLSDSLTADRLKSHLVVLHDDDFTHFVRHATEVVARIGLDYERKTVKTGALFYQEFLPPETIFYSWSLPATVAGEGPEVRPRLPLVRDGHPRQKARAADRRGRIDG